MLTSLRRPREDTEIQDRLESLAHAIREKNLDAVMAHYAPDVVVFDVMPPLDVQSSADYRKNFERWFGSMTGPIDYEMNGLRISISESHAFCHFVGHVIGTRKTGEKADYWVRVTTCFQKANGQWLVGHEHVSMPASTQGNT